jgi:alkanesulfonate monooxygenase SsuD/methylene tetrahydromethanopterin reductase-like flavin-dependent oxidoreductase (luciferase family)
MKIVIGLPNNVAGVPGTLMGDWARRAEQRGFAGVATIDRLVYPSLDSVVALALAAGASAHLELITNVLLAPLYPAEVLAKQLGSLAAAAPDRLVAGLGVGARPDDYAAAGVEFDRRGRLLDDMVTVLRRVWAAGNSTPSCPSPVRIPLLFGGFAEPALRRATTVGDGWAAGALRRLDEESAFADRVRDRWRTAGRRGTPVLHTSVNVALGGDDVTDPGRQHLLSYYGNKPDFARLNAADMLTTARDARQTCDAYRAMGFDRLLFHPAVASLDQVDRLADAVL